MKNYNKKPVPLEKEIQSSICEYLDLRNVFFWRQNTSPTFNQNAGMYQAMPKYALRGVPDIIVIKKGKFIGLECKRPGAKQSEHQLLFQDNCERNDGEYYIVTSIEDVQKIGL